MKYVKIDIRLIVIVGYHLFLSLVSVLFPLALMKVTDALTQGEWNEFQYYLMLSFAVLIAQMSLTYVSSRVGNTYVMQRMNEVRKRLMHAILHSRYTDFKKKKNEEYLSLLLTNVQTLENDYYSSGITIMSKSILIIASIIALLLLNSLLTFSVIAVIVLLAFFPLLFSKRILKQKQELIESTEKYTASATECLYGFEVIKINAIIHKVFHKYTEKAEKMGSDSRKMDNTISLANVVFGSSTMVLILLVFLIGGYSVSQGLLSIGSLIACTQLIMYVLEPAVQLAQEVNVIRSTQPIRQQLDNIIANSKQEAELERSATHEQVHSIRMKNVSYRYGVEQRMVLQDFSFDFQAGKRYALIGPNGSGKSTVLKIIAGLIDDYSGSLSMNNAPDTKGKIANPGYVDQQNFLFNSSIYENLYISGDEHHDPVFFLSMLEQIGLDTYLSNQAEGTDFIVGEAGQLLSGGERQKICIARALLKNKGLLLMDEPQSALDPEGVDRLMDLLEQLENTLCIVVTHKQDESLRMFDQLLVMEEGRLVKAGRYDDLFSEDEPKEAELFVINSLNSPIAR
ncbi:ABC transporter ATP-binding protein [Saccharibacillus sacchari]|uniref:ABC transporter ATP-binding protein n=1 Tax=Saccharibacillus sacchari TaxID=456493 RepID=A0ACC6PA45_9BACL